MRVDLSPGCRSGPATPAALFAWHSGAKALKGLLWMALRRALWMGSLPLKEKRRHPFHQRLQGYRRLQTTPTASSCRKGEKGDTTKTDGLKVAKVTGLGL